MSVKIEKQENSKVVLEFTMSKEDFSKNLDKAFTKNAKLFKVPGFRNGKVPRKVVEKMYGENVLYETVIEDNVDEDFKNAVEENKFELVSKPELDVKQIGKDKEFIYTVTFFVKPEASIKNYKGLEIEKFNTKVSNEDIEKELVQVQEKNARIISVEGRKLQDKDISTINFEGFLDGVPFEGGKGENHELTIGSGQFIPGFEEQLIGMEIGETKEITVTFPKDYHSTDLSSKEVIFKVELISIKEKELPKLDDDFAKDVSEFETLEEYKKSLEEKVKNQKENAAKADKEEKVIAKLTENTEVEIPEAMIAEEVEHMLEQFTSNLSYQGLTMDKYCEYIGTTLDNFKETLKPNAIKDIKLKLALEIVQKSENIEVTDAEVDVKLDELSKEYGNENTSDFKNNENARHYMKERILQDKVLAFVVDSSIQK